MEKLYMVWFVSPHCCRRMWHWNQFWLFLRNQKKINLKGNKRGLTKALEFDLTDKERGMKQGEIAKKKKKKKQKKKKKKQNLINHNLLVCVLILHQAFAHYQIQICSKLSNLLVIKMGSLHYSHKCNNRSFFVHHYNTQIK